MIVRRVVILNGLKGKLEVVEKKKTILDDFKVDRSPNEYHIKINIYVEI
jgi:hypothetical protein